MLKVAICDDEQYIVEELEYYIDQFYKNLQISLVIKTYNSGVDLILSQQRYDVIFLDVDMEPLNGIETAERLRKDGMLAAKIIYVTKYTDFSKKALKVHAFAYLVKPLAAEELQKVLTEIIEYHEVVVKQQNFVFITEQGNLNLPLDDIYYFEKDGRQVKLVCSAGTFMTRYKLYYLIEKLKDRGFESVHKSILVNQLHVRLIKGFEVHLDNGHVVPLAQKKAPVFREKHNLYLQRMYNMV